MTIPPVNRVLASYDRMQKPEARKVPGRPPEEHRREDPRERITVPATLELAPGDVLFAEGDAADCAYFVESGSLDIYVVRDGEERPVNRVPADEVVGEMAVFDAAPRSACARAAAPTRLRRIDPGVLAGMLDAAPPGLKGLVEALIKRLRGNVPIA